MDFSHSVFASHSGQALQSLIVSLVKKEPGQRLSINDALEHLRQIQLQHDRGVLLEKIASFKYIPGAAEFVKKMGNAQDLQQLTQSYQQHLALEACYQMLKDLPKTDDLHQSIPLQLKNSPNMAIDIQAALYVKLENFYVSQCNFLMEQINHLDNRPCTFALRNQFKERINQINHYDDFCQLRNQLEIYQKQVALLPVCQILAAELRLHSDLLDMPDFEQALNSYETDFSKLKVQLFCFQKQCECHAILKQLESLKFGDKDSPMADFLKELKIEIASKKSIEELDQLSIRLSKALENLQNPVLAELRDIIKGYRQKSENIFSFGSAEKADNIEHAIAQMRLEQRMQLHQSNKLEQELEEVYSQLASKRLFGKSEGFDRFKQALQAMQQSSKNKVDDEGSSPTKPKI